MSSLAVRVEGIGKQYQLGLREKRNQTFREAMVDMAAAPWRRLRHLSGRSGEDDTFWALKDICFDVPEGEVLGIIGHNGAGKSTLLKILSRITEPTEGRATIHGRVASLLEVGTGFHNELTGRENVYLNGAILGMSRREIDRKFDEIVDFAGVEKFLDTPIKRYSTGMKVRLAFAVAAHLDPEILIIDEVLAVGDQEFQNKCLGKMQDVATSGRTVLFVSHNMAAVESLCSRATLLGAGQVLSAGRTKDVIDGYLQISVPSDPNVSLADAPRSRSVSVRILRAARILDIDGTPLRSVGLGCDFILEIEVDCKDPLTDVGVGINFFDSRRTRVTTFHTRYQHAGGIELEGPATICCHVSDFRLVPAVYTADLIITTGSAIVDQITSALTIVVSPSDIYGTGRIPVPKNGPYVCDGRWTVDCCHFEPTAEQATR